MFEEFSKNTPYDFLSLCPNRDSLTS
jgi:hypothetical protein